MTAPLKHSADITVDVALGDRAYDIVIGRDVLPSLGARVAALRPGVRTAIVTDRTVAKHWLEPAESSLAAAGIPISRIIVEEGEGSKSYSGLEKVSEALISAKIERNDLVIALGDEVFFAWLEANHADIFSGGAAREHAIATSCRAKSAIVSRDERETGERALLNLGHTFGHALEAATGFSDRLFHGEGVSVGMVLAAEFSAELGMIPQTDAARVERHLASVGLPTHLQDIAGFAQEGLADADTLMALMAQDKKVKRGKLTFILLQAVGRAVIANDVEPSLVRDFLKARLAKS